MNVTRSTPRTSAALESGNLFAWWKATVIPIALDLEEEVSAGSKGGRSYWFSSKVSTGPWDLERRGELRWCSMHPSLYHKCLTASILERWRCRGSEGRRAGAAGRWEERKERNDAVVWGAKGWEVRVFFLKNCEDFFETLTWFHK